MADGMNSAESVDEDIERMEGCYKLLLDAGSDISSVHEFDLSSAFSHALMGDSLVRRSYRSSLFMK